MPSDFLKLTPDTLAVFIDEAGIEDYSDPNNPTFGRGGCAVLGPQYLKLIKKPWRQLKREKMGGATKAFHATDFEHSGPSKVQISAINRFLRQPFWRFAVMSDAKTALPPGIDGHRAVSLLTVRFVTRLVAKYDVKVVALVFESSERGDELVQRDFDLASMQLFNRAGVRVVVDGYFMDKACMEAGLEIADLVAHTAGRQRRHELAGKPGHAKDFQQMYWHSPIPPAFMSINTVELREMAIPEGPKEAQSVTDN
jgi:Protein of unknown function (DUF3800)